MSSDWGTPSVKADWWLFRLSLQLLEIIRAYVHDFSRSQTVM
jgi:hypothetical protein